MAQNRVRIVDVADSLGLSTATVSKVIHGKTEKISDETVKRVQLELERSGYIPNMAGILLARNNSRIIGVVVNDHVKYEGRVLEDGFVMSSLNALSHEVNEKGYFLMIKTTSDISEIPVFASMWNMEGLILMGFCEADYEKLRNQMRISFVVYDGYFEKCSKVVNLVINHYDGGYQAGKYLKELGHEKALCIADNFICMDKERIEGFCKAFEPGEILRWEIPKTEKERMRFYDDKYTQLLKGNVTAVFAVSDFYAVELMKFLQGRNIRIPEDIQIIGFDDNRASRESNPSLTTIHQEAPLRAKTAIKCLEAMRNGTEYETEIVLPVELIKRESTRKL
jgi:LacI family transcriptional regulator